MITMVNEMWMPIAGYNGAYTVSNIGKVFANETYVFSHGMKFRKVPHELKSACNGHGYRYVTISLNRVRKNYYVHRLVAEAFIPNPLNLPQVNHINGIKTDNRVENLEWCDAFRNQQHALSIGLRKKGGEAHGAIKVIDTKNGKTYGSIKEFSQAAGVSYSCAKDAMKRTSPRRKNFPYEGVFVAKK